MGFKLPELTTDVDCEEIGYSGLVFRFLLNATNPAETWVSPELRDPPVEEPDPWDTLWYQGLGRALVCVIIPGKFSDTGKREVIDIPDAQAFYELERAPGFEHDALKWALDMFMVERPERLKVERKN